MIGWGLKVKAGRLGGRLREEAKGGLRIRQEGAWPSAGETLHLVMHGDCLLLGPLGHSAVFLLCLVSLLDKLPPG